MKQITLALFVFIASITSVFAAGNADAGKAKSATCAACHGANGLNPSPTYPDLAGQHAAYIAKQLLAFKNGDRNDPLMSPMAKNLSEQDMADLGAYFESQPRTAAKADAGSSTSASVQAPVKYEPSAAAGKSLYELGDETRSIGQCIGCHGKDGNSDVLIYPNLAKQHAGYIAKQLKAFKAGERSNNYAMNQFASKLTDNEIEDIAAYFADTKAVAHVKARKKSAPLAASKDVLAGKDKSAACAACHGADGNSPLAMYPKLAGQNAAYIVKQLAEFKSGARKDPVMAPMAAGLSEQDAKEIAAYFSAQLPAKGDGEANLRGQKLYLGGDKKYGITACVACHGINGKGMPHAGFPAVANQNSQYLAAQLMKFKKSERDNDHNAMMRKTVRKLKPADIDALSQYMSSLK